MGEARTPHFYDFWIIGRVQTPQNQLFFIFGDSKTLNKNPQKTLERLTTYYFFKISEFGTP